MTFPRIRAPGTWILGSVLQPGEEELFDDHQANAIDGRDGGAYAPSAVLTIGGSGMHVTATLTADDLRAHVNDGQTLVIDPGGAIQVEAAGADIGVINVLDGARILVNADSGAGGALLVCDGDAYFNNGATVEIRSGAALDVKSGSATTIAGALTVTGLTAFNTTGSLHDVSFGATTKAYFAGNSTHPVEFAYTPRITTAGPVLIDPAASADTDAAVMVQSGLIRLDAAPSATTDPGADAVVCAGNVTRARATAHSDGVGGIIVDGGFNVAGVGLIGSAGAQGVRLTFARAMPDTTYTAVATGAASGSLVPCAFIGAKGTSTLDVYFWDVQGGGPIDLATKALPFDIIAQ